MAFSVLLTSANSDVCMALGLHLERHNIILSALRGFLPLIYDILTSNLLQQGHQALNWFVSFRQQVSESYRSGGKVMRCWILDFGFAQPMLN